MHNGLSYAQYPCANPGDGRTIMSVLSTWKLLAGGRLVQNSSVEGQDFGCKRTTAWQACRSSLSAHSLVKSATIVSKLFNTLSR